MPAAKTCDTNCVLLPACREAFPLTTQLCFKRNHLENIPILQHASAQTIATSAVPHPQNVCKNSWQPFEQGELGLGFFGDFSSLQASKSSFPFPSTSREGARWAPLLSEAISFSLRCCYMEINNLCSALLLSSPGQWMQLPHLPSSP